MSYLRHLSRPVSHFGSYTNRAASTISFSEEVKQAKADGKPVVALESTIITHGMPYPQNLETAVQVENIIRESGATPATVAILKGQLTVGLSEEQLNYLSRASDVVKASRRDLAPVSAALLDGATTVAGTLVAAELADIPIFVTGGIGGVHRNGENTMDVSADLNELGRSNTLVVCSGVKSILDIGRTLEYLETQGVCVCAYGETDDFPAFYTRRSGHLAPHRVLDSAHAARILHAARKYKLHSGIVVAVPVPKEHAMDEKIIEEAIDCALKEARQKNILGKDVTPFILSAVAKATGGASLAANIALIKNNAKVGADIAIEFNKLKNVYNLDSASNIGISGSVGKCLSDTSRKFHTSSVVHDCKDLEEMNHPILPVSNADGDVLVIGGSNVDKTYRVTEDRIQLDGSTHACTAAVCGGGVARNVAEALWRLRDGRVRLLTAIGDDADGEYIARIAPGLLLDGCVVQGQSTSTYAAVLDAKGECLLGLGDMRLHDNISIDLVNNNIEVLKRAPLVVIDGNSPQATINYVLKICHELHKPVFFEPTDRRKAVKALNKLYHPTISTPNISELHTMATFLEPKLEHDNTKLNNLDEILKSCKIVSQFIKIIVITMGADGILIVRSNSHLNNKTFTAHLYPVESITKIKNVSGAGDCFASGFIHGLLLGHKESFCVSFGLQAARCTLQCNNTVPMNLNSCKPFEVIHKSIGW